MSTLMQASNQWATRPADERYTSLPEMLATMQHVRAHSRATVVSSHRLEAQPVITAGRMQPDQLVITGPNGHAYEPTNWSFGQLAGLAKAPAGYLRTLPSPIVADALNYGLRFNREAEDVGVLLHRNDDAGTFELRAATGPQYGRIWNADLIAALISHVGDGVSGDWRVPGEFGKRVTVTKANTTLFASDRDCFVFLADEDRRIEMPNRRDGQPGSLARGFFCWNSEVGSRTMGIATFLFDYVCCNRIVWGAEAFKQITIRHTAKAPDRWLEEVEPALIDYARSSTAPVLDMVKAAQAKKIDDVDAFLLKRFSARQVTSIKAAHEADEGRPIESLWDATTAVTAFARGVTHQDARIDLEKIGGEILEMAA